MKKSILLFVTSMIISFIGLTIFIFYGLPQTDELVCEVNQGDRYLLKSKYMWTPLSPNPVHPSIRNSQDDYSVFFKRKESDKWINTGAFVQYNQIDAPGSAESLCAEVGVKNGTPLLFLSWMDKNGHWYDWPYGFPESLSIYSITINGTKPFILEQLKGIDGTPDYYRTPRIMPFNNQLIYELPVTNENVEIKAVFKSVSSDNGKTWSALKLSRVPDIFEMSKKRYEQSFGAKPIMINGERVIKGGDRRSRGSINGVRQKQILD